MTGPGSQRATIYSVAEMAGVSIATVSRVVTDPDHVSPVRRERVLAAIDRLNYVPLSAARSLAVQRHDAHGLVLPELTGVYFAELLAGYESAASELGQSVTVVIAQGKRDLVRAARSLATRVDGLTIMGSAGVPTAVITSLATIRPVIVIAGADAPGVETVRAESRSWAVELTGRLLDAGRRRVIFVGDPTIAADVLERHDGFVEAHRARGLRPLKHLSVVLDERAGRGVADRLLRRKTLPDAIVCANDMLALAVMDRLGDHGVDVPGDVAITGWDDLPIVRYVRPRLTTVRQPVRELAALAATRLHGRIVGDGPTALSDWGRSHLLPSQLVLRDSCGTAYGVSPPAASA